jgi:protein involved in polysaccharide export with SLBB domain
VSIAHHVRPLVSAFATLLFLAACGGPPIGEPFEKPAPRPPAPPLTIVPGDMIEVEYLRSATSADDYRLELGDRVRIELQLHSELTASVTVAPDGTITYHRIGAVKAKGKTIEELRTTLAAALAPHFPQPEVTVFLEQGDVAVDRFIDTLLRHPQGTLREVQVEDDGTISLPACGTIPVTGLTPRIVEERLNESIGGRFPSLRVSVRPKTLSRAMFSVLGEVTRPGRFGLNGPTSLADAIALAGGQTPVGDLSSVVVIGEPVDDNVDAWLYDLQTALDHGSSLAQVRLHPQDTVLVLRSGIGDVNEFIDRYIRRNIPINVNVTYRIDTNGGSSN